MLIQHALLAAAFAIVSCTPLHAQDTVKGMPPNAHPGFEVSTIKPANPEDVGKDFSFEGRIFYVKTTTLKTSSLSAMVSTRNRS